MPRIIRHALFRKISQLPELRQTLEDFHLIAGRPVVFVDDLGQPHAQPLALGAMCRYVQRTPAGAELCRRTRERLLAAAPEHPACVTCDAGLQEAAVALRLNGIVVGYFLLIGTLARQAAPAQGHRAEHLLRREGVDARDDELAGLLRRAPRIPAARLHAYLRFLDHAAHAIARRMTAPLDHAPEDLPPLVAQACRAVRRRALTENLSLQDVAAECDVSPSHLSRSFHHAAMMTFRQYVAWWRAEHAGHLLVSTHRPITHIAFDSGFQSLSQFNRVFRSIYGYSPRQLRARRRANPTVDLRDATPNPISPVTPNPVQRRNQTGSPIPDS